MDGNLYVKRIVEGFFDSPDAYEVEDDIKASAAAGVLSDFKVVDLELPSGTLWAVEDLNGGEEMNWFDAKAAADRSCMQMPTYRQIKELIDKCRITVSSDEDGVAATFVSPTGKYMTVDLSGSGWCHPNQRGKMVNDSNFPYAWWADLLDEKGEYALAVNVTGVGYHQAKNMCYWPSRYGKNRCRLCTPPKE